MFWLLIDIPKIVIIGASLVIIISYFFTLFARKTRFPSVVLLICLGIIISYILKYFNLPEYDFIPILEILGIIGLIMIVLEAALELKLKKQKTGIILKSFFIAFLGVVINAVLAAVVIRYISNISSFQIALIYAIPISVMSSAIVIPSVRFLDPVKKEFMIYESTFSDIIGIIFFYSLLVFVGAESKMDIGIFVSSNILITILIAFILSYFILFLLQKLKTDIKLFFIISILVLFYAIGKLFNLSSLILVLIFGLVLANHNLFVKGFLKKYINNKEIDKVFHGFQTITIESSFLVRTFFFVIFGMSVVLGSLLNFKVVILSIIVLLILYASRFILLRLFFLKNFKPELFIAPRGLISVLLFFSIPEQYTYNNFEAGTLLLIIISTSLIMAYALIVWRKKEQLQIINKPESIPDEEKNTKEWDINTDEI